jgi:hypothetical protein
LTPVRYFSRVFPRQRFDGRPYVRRRERRDPDVSWRIKGQLYALSDDQEWLGFVLGALADSGSRPHTGQE